MTTLVCERLVTTLTQEIKLNQYRVYNLAGIKIKLMMFNNPVGTFTLSIKSGSDVLFSQEFDSADIKAVLSTTDNYAYLDLPITTGFLPLKSGSYDLVLSSSGYTFAESSYISWVKSYQNIFNDREVVETDFTANPFDVLIYEYTRGDLQQ